MPPEIDKSIVSIILAIGFMAGGVSLIFNDPALAGLCLSTAVAITISILNQRTPPAPKEETHDF